MTSSNMHFRKTVRGIEALSDMELEAEALRSNDKLAAMLKAYHEGPFPAHEVDLKALAIDFAKLVTVSFLMVGLPTIAYILTMPTLSH